MIVKTRHSNPALYAHMKSRLPGYKFEPEEDFYEYPGALRYLYHILHKNDRTIMNCDEDCFITDPEALDDLFAYMCGHGYDYCGMSDGGTHHRNNDPVVMNPFFNIFMKCVTVDMPYHELKLCHNQEVKTDTLAQLAKVCRHKHEAQMSEPFNPIFRYLEKNFHPLYLQAELHPDGVSTILLNHKGVPFCVHSWYSRAYGVDPEQTNRIKALL